MSFLTEFRKLIDALNYLGLILIEGLLVVCTLVMGLVNVGMCMVPVVRDVMSPLDGVVGDLGTM